LSLEQSLFYGCACSLIVAALLSSVSILKSKKTSKTRTEDGNQADQGRLKGFAFSNLELIALIFTLAGGFSITASILVRTFETGHGPFTSMYEFSVSFVWGVLAATVFFSWKYRASVLNLAGIIFSIGLLIFADSISMGAAPLVPALQNSVLLSCHVASAVVAYGSFTIGFIASILLIIQKDDRFSTLPKSKVLEKISYHSVVIGFPFMTLVIVLGAIWADIAWGKFWSWDPKETASLLTWLIYAGYLHMRVIRGLKGRRAALLLVIGFAAVIFTFFGNYIFDGLHSYG
jgi:cytochrome c-type biogenesis protein CcsB